MFLKLQELQELDPNITVEMFRLKQNVNAVVASAKTGQAGGLTQLSRMQEAGALSPQGTHRIGELQAEQLDGAAA